MNKVSQRDLFVTAADGTQIFVTDRGDIESRVTPLLCLPGLTRHSGDFEPVFDVHATSRRVIGIDFRGRGKSAHAIDPSSYRPQVELADVLSVLDHLKISRCAVLGTSRGGIVGMLMANVAPTRIAGLMLNDIGAELEPEGLLRILEHVGKPSRFRDWDDAAHKFSKSAVGFDDVTHTMWRSVVRRIFQYSNGSFVHRHDLRLVDSLPTKAEIKSGKVANLWSLLPALTELPCSLLRGSGSDLLSLRTVGKMRAALPGLDYTEVSGRGHVPFLDEVESVAAMARWLAAVDAKEKGQAVTNSHMNLTVSIDVEESLVAPTSAPTGCTDLICYRE